jgi:NAD-dependent SIR2 family protein deacetylase
LKPKTGVDLSAHKMLLDIATTQEGKVRLVTTNFDRLFDKCGNKASAWKSPRLPDPALQSEFDGIIYLHGCTDKR